MVETKLYDLLVIIKDKIDGIEKAIDRMEHKVETIENKLQNNAVSQSQVAQVAMVTTISTSEEKINVLNKQTKADTQEDLLKAMRERTIIEKSGVLDILDQTITIYDHIADIVYNFNDESSCKYIYGFSDSKNNLYYWNNDKKTWAKMSKAYLSDIFMTIQQKIIMKYNELMQNNPSLKAGCVENGDLIFADDFEKKYSDFKKTLISKFV